MERKSVKIKKGETENEKQNCENRSMRKVKEK